MQFLFSARDPKTGTDCSGTIEALSTPAAQAQLARRGLQEVKIRLDSRKASPPTPEPDTRPRLDLRDALAVASVVLGLGWVGLHFWSSAGQLTLSGPSARLTRLEWAGRLQLPPAANVSEVSAHVHLPEVPYDIFRKGAELELDGEGNYRFRLELTAAVRPQVCSLTFSCRGCDARELRLLSFQESGPDSLHCAVGPLELVKASPLPPSVARNQPSRLARQPEPRPELPPGFPFHPVASTVARVAP